MSLLTPERLSDEFAKQEAKGLQVAEVRLRALPRSFTSSVGYKDGTFSIWGARLVLDKRLKANQLKLKTEELLEPVTPKKIRTVKVTL